MEVLLVPESAAQRMAPPSFDEPPLQLAPEDVRACGG